MKLSKRDSSAVLQALKTLVFHETNGDRKTYKYTRRPSRYWDNPYKPCISALERLHGHNFFVVSSLHWLGVTLCQAGVLEFPVIDPKDWHTEQVEHRHRHLEWCRAPYYNNVTWYWDMKIVMWGVRAYNRRQKR